MDLAEKNTDLEALKEPSVDNNNNNDVSLPDDLDTRVTKNHVAFLVDNAKNILQGRPLSKSNIIGIAFRLYTLSMKMKNSNGSKMKGIVKKDALLAALKNLINSDKSLSEEDKDNLFAMLDMVSITIDARYAEDKQKNTNCCVIV